MADSPALWVAIVSFVAGMRAAILWYRASKVNVAPIWEHDGQIEPIDPTRASQHLIIATYQTMQQSSALNRRAAVWTALSVVAGAASTLIAVLTNG
ncbi:hypothetical protein [Sphingomonas sp.]|uniref:hypothetical protein n=1 Tax=Sphingomonas sp. TaxID=28214 RepID=UPI0025E2B0C8|nr:hypothetical protein [Sphingomonas sp.]